MIFITHIHSLASSTCCVASVCVAVYINYPAKMLLTFYKSVRYSQLVGTFKQNYSLLMRYINPKILSHSST